MSVNSTNIISCANGCLHYDLANAFNRRRGQWWAHCSSAAAARLVEQVAEEEGWSVEDLHKYLAECESEEGRAKYGEDQCDTELTRLWKRIDGA